MSTSDDTRPRVAVNQNAISHGAIGVNVAHADQVITNNTTVIGDPASLGLDDLQIVEHDEYVAQLQAFQRFLTQANLPFVPPAEGSPTHPMALWARLQETERPGILLVGSGGVGKTRTAFEVACLAAADGWRVIHLLPADRPLSLERLRARVCADPRPTLLVFDYLDQMPDLDFRALRLLRGALVIARAPIALLGNSRPGWVRTAHAERDTLFEITPLTPEEDQRSRILAAMLEVAAPNASYLMGEPRLRELCGDRPIIALLIALELERRALAGRLGEDIVQGIRSGDLLGWLRRRLEGDKVRTSVSSSPWEPPITPPEVLAVASVLACAPQGFEALTDAAEAALVAGGGEGERAGFIVASLVQLGWLESEGVSLRTAHDVVADEVLEQVLAPQHPVPASAWSTVFAPWTRRSRHISRLATSLTRMMVSKPDAHGWVAERITAGLNSWWPRGSEAAGKVLAEGAAVEGAYALGTLLWSPMWQEHVLASWTQVVTPWLTRWSSAEAARHVFYTGLRIIPVGQAGELTAQALAWLGHHATASVASFVISALLGRDDLSGAAASTVTGAAVAWFSAHGHKSEAAYVLHPLLHRTDLDTAHANATIEVALSWLSQNGEEPQAQPVHGRLLLRSDLGAAQARAAVQVALAWLSVHDQKPEAGFVLGPLLRRRELQRDQLGCVVGAALEWIKRHHFGSASCSPSEQRPERAGLDRSEDPGDPTFVLKGLLSRDDLDGKTAESVVATAVAWLEVHAEEVDSQYVLTSLLDRRYVGRHHATIVSCATRWVAQHAENPGADFVIRRLLRQGSVEPVVLEGALRWARLNASNPDADWVLSRLLLRDEIHHDAWNEVASLALKWLSEDRGATAFMVLGAIGTRWDNLGVDDRAEWAAAVRRLPRDNQRTLQDVARELARVAVALDRGEDATFKTLRRLVSDVERALDTGCPPTPGDLRHMLRLAIQRALTSPRDARFAIPALVAGTADDDTGLAGYVDRFVRLLLEDHRLSAAHHYAIGLACEQRLNQGRWPSVELVEQRYRALGLIGDED